MPRTGRPKKSVDVNCKCRTCGKEYTKPVWQNTGKEYCSRECFYKARVGIPREDLRAPIAFKTCPICGTEFRIGGTGNKKKSQKFCSEVCQVIGQQLQPKPRDMSDTEIAWLAGLIEGEGTIVWPRIGRKSVRLGVTNTYYPLLEKILEVVGTGSIIGKVRSKPNPKHSESWDWQCYGENARIVLQMILPWLIVKRERAEIALGIRPLSDWKRLREEETI